MTVAPVAPAPAAPGTGATAGATPGSGDLFAGLLALPMFAGGGAGSGAGSALPFGSETGIAEAALAGVLPGLPVAEPTGHEPVETLVEGEPVVLSAAQIIAAAQVVPAAPMIAHAVRLAAVPSTAAAEAVVTPAGSGVPAAGPDVGTTLPAVAEPTAEPPSVHAGAAEALYTEGGSATPATTPGAEPPAMHAGAAKALYTEGGSATTPVAEQGDPAGQTTGQTTDPTTSQTASQTGHAANEGSGQGSNQNGSTPQPSGSGEAGAVTAAGAPSAPAPAVGKGEAATPAYGVTSQVHGEVSRLVSRGDGTRRITIKLQPEALGDVRVVLTVRNGEVHVRMAGGELAQQALLHGAPELHRLLEAAGASSSQVVVGDQGSSQFGDHAGRQASGEPQEGASEGGHHDHRNARTRDGDTSARDGSTGRAHERPSTAPGTRTPLGVDVTM